MMDIQAHQSNSTAQLDFGFKKRLPVILQTEAAECGLVCLAMIAGYHGFNTDLINLRRRFSISSHGTNLQTLINVATRMSLAPRALKVESEQIGQLQLPCIIHWDMNHFVVLKDVKRNKVRVHDPACGERSLNKSEFDKHYTGVALELTPTSGFEVGEEKNKLGLRHFWSRIIGLRRSLAHIFLISLLLQFFAIATPLYMQTVIDDVILRSDSNLLMVLAIGFGLLLLIQVGTNVLREFVILQISSRLNIQMAVNLFRHLIFLPADYFAKRHMGDVVSRFGSLKNIRDFLATGYVSAAVDGIMAVITLTAMFIYDVKLTFIVIIVVVLYATLRFALFRPLRLLTEESILAQARHDSHFMESVRAIQTIKIFQRESFRQSQWQNRLADVINQNIRIQRWHITYDTINRLLFGIENIVVVYFGAQAVMGNIMSVGMLYAFISYKKRFVDSMDGLIAKWIEFKMMGLHLDRLADIAFEPAENQEQMTPNNSNILPSIGSGGLEHEDNRIVGRIEVRDLCYSYGESDSPAFQNVNFVIEAGETVAITGPSGCGKTTLIKCLMGLLIPTSGTILIDGRPIEKHKGYRSQIAGVMQEDQLMSGSIAENIACFSPQCDMERVAHSAQLACVHDEIMSMPMQYNTLVGDMGMSMSGGQKQRIVMARALYRGPSILFMDEATSHLDVRREAEVNVHVKSLKITRVLVAHRPETIGSAQRTIEIGH